MLLLLWRLLLALLDGFRQIYVLQVEKAVTSLLEFYKVYQYSEFYATFYLGKVRDRRENQTSVTDYFILDALKR